MRKGECHLHPLACRVMAEEFECHDDWGVFHKWRSFICTSLYMCCMKYKKGIASWNMQWHLPLCMISQLINYPFQASLNPVDSNLNEYCYWLSTKRQFNFCHGTKKIFFLTVGCILCYLDNLQGCSLHQYA